MVRHSIFYAAAAFAVAAILFQGCQSKEEDKGEEEKPVPELDIYSDNYGPETEESYHPVWKAGESISVFSKTAENREFRFKGSDGDKTGSFEPVSEAKGNAAAIEDYYAASPYSQDNSISEAGVLSLTLPKTQAYVKGGTDPAAQLLAAKSQDHNFQFLNVGGVLSFGLKGPAGTEISAITLQGNDGEKLSGLMEITFGKDIQCAFPSQDASTSITLNSTQPVELNPDSPTVFSIIVPPVTFSKGITLTVSDPDGKECIIQTESSLELKRGKTTRTDIDDDVYFFPYKLGIYQDFYHNGTPVKYRPGAMQVSVFEAESKLWTRFLEMATLKIYMLGPIPAQIAKGDVFESTFTVTEAGEQKSSEALSFEVLDTKDGIITLLSGEDSYFIVRI